MNRDGYEATRTLFEQSELGTVVSKLVGIHGSSPYWYLTVERECPAQEAGRWVVPFATMAIATGGYFTMHTINGCCLSIAVSCRLTAEEIETEKRLIEEQLS